MRINYNVSAMIANNALSDNDNLLAKSLERLSSGLKINSAKDNPAGLAMAKRMNAQIEGLNVASQNASDGVSIIETADGALSEIQDMVQRISELAVKASNSILEDSDRKTIQDEVNQLKEEMERIASSTEFNSQKLLDGSFDLKAYTSEEDIGVKTVSDEVAIKVYTIDSMVIERDAGGNPVYKEDGSPSVQVQFGDGFPDRTYVKEIKDNLMTVVADNGFEMKLDVSNMTDNAAGYTDMKIDVTGIGAMRLQIGSNEGQVLGVRIPKISLKDMGIDEIDMSTKDGAEDALQRMTGANGYISSVRSRLGAYQNRLESSINSLDITSENMTSAYSRIMDVDMAEEMTNYTTYQVLTQAGTSMLAQANERPSQVLQLLQ